MAAAQRLGTAFVTVAIWVVPLGVVLLLGGSGAFEFGLIRVTYDALAIVAILAWLGYALIHREWLPASRLWPGLVAILGAYVISSVVSRSPRLSLEMAAYAFLLVALYLLLVALMRRRLFRLQFERLALALAVIVSALYVLQVGRAWFDWWGVVGRVAIPPLRPGYLGLLINPNPLATVALGMGAFALATISWRGRSGKATALCLLVLVGIAVLLTGSRGAWLGMAVAVGVCGVLVLAMNSSARRWIITHTKTRSGIAVAGLLTVAFVIALLLAARSGRLTVDDNGYRASFAAASLRMFQSSPIAGVGPGLWPVLRGEYTRGDEINAYLPHAHNVYLQSMAEFGILAALAGAVVVISLLRLGWSALSSADAKRQRVGLAAVFVLVLLATQQLVDMLMNVPAVLLALAMPLAWIDAASLGDARHLDGLAQDQARSDLYRRAAAVGMTCITLVSAVGLIRVESVATAAADGVAAVNMGSWATATKRSSAAATADPEVGAYAFAAGLSFAGSGARDLDVVAAKWFRQSAEADDYPYAWLNLAALRWISRDTEEARQALLRAERLSARRSPLAVAEGWLRWQLGDLELAESDFAAALAADPTLLSDPYWESMPDLKADWPSVIELARERVEATALGDASRVAQLFRFDVLSGDYASAGEVLEEFPANERSSYQLVLDAWQARPGAEDALFEAARQNPTKLDLVRWNQLLAARRGDEGAVRRFGSWLWLTDGSGSEAPVARISPPPAPGMDVGLDSYQHVYRRPVPEQQLIDVLPQVVSEAHF